MAAEKVEIILSADQAWALLKVLTEVQEVHDYTNVTERERAAVNGVRAGLEAGLLENLVG